MGIKYYRKESPLKQLVDSIFVEEYDKISEEIWYHGSDRPIDKFQLSKVGREGRISFYYGHGIYFINSNERAQKYGEVVTKVRIDPNANIMRNQVTHEQVTSVYQQLNRDNVKLQDYDHEFFLNPKYHEYSVLTDVLEFYDYLVRRFRENYSSMILVSDFLKRAGIDGMQVTNDVGDEILVVFNQDIITVIE